MNKNESLTKNQRDTLALLLKNFRRYIRQECVKGVRLYAAFENDRIVFGMRGDAEAQFFAVEAIRKHTIPRPVGSRQKAK